jgi:hypothetical protein
MFAANEWEQLYQQALLELDDAKLKERISAAEKAVNKRLVEIQGNGKPNQQSEERHKLEDALHSLQYLRRISPGWSNDSV